MHMIDERALAPARLAEFVDERCLCFEQDTTANFIIARDGTLRHANTVGRALLFRGHLQLDSGQRLCLSRRASRHGPAGAIHNLGASTGPHVRQVGPTRWLVISVRPLAGPLDLLHVRACEISLDSQIDLQVIAEELGVSDCEAPVLQGLAQAICPKDISRSLGLSIHTIRSHIRSIYAKLGVRSAGEAQLRVLQVYYVMKAIDGD